jgi:two-component sensor histidine kinase
MKNGKVIGLQGVAHDVTEQKHAEEALVRSLKEKEVLLKEIHHRVKNNLQVICSMLNMQASEAQAEGVTTALQEAQARVLSMALIHERLYSVADFSRIDLLEYSQSLANHLARTWKRTGIRVSIGGSRTFVGVDAAIPYGLILNELVTNALKHAFVGREKGQVDVTVERKSDTSVEMGVKDDGIGFPPGKDFKDMVSMGMTLVTNLVAQLNGTITMMDSEGAHFVIQFSA